MKLPKKTIGVLDLNIDNLYLLNSLRETFKNDDIYYINDTSVENVDEINKDELNEIIAKNLNYLLSKNIEVLLVVSDSIVEFCNELFSELQIPVFNIIDETVNFVNEAYEYKNVGFLSTNSMIEANIYQKNIRYNHLYTMNGDELIKVIRTNLVKTSESFQETKNVIAPVYKKDLDIIVPSICNYLMVKTEIHEYLKDVEIINVIELLVNCVKNTLYKDQELPQKGKGITYLCSNQAIEEKSINRILKDKYKLINTNETTK